MHSESQVQTAAHSHDEVVQALAGLTQADMNRLTAAAGIWIRDLGLDPAVQDADDLVAEAVFRTTSGQRTWRQGVDFYHHLRQIMKSIVDSWHKSAQRRRASGDFALRENQQPWTDPELSDDEARAAGLLAAEPTPERDPLEKMIGKEDVRAFEADFAGDEAALAVIEGIKWDMKGPAVQRQWGLTQKQYEAGRRRIWRYRDQQGGRRGR